MPAIMTDQVYPNEACHGLYEGPWVVPGLGGDDLRWVQKIWVVRGDAIARYEADLGPAEDYDDVTPLLMPSQGDDTVAEMQAWAEKNRHDHYWQKRGQELLEGSTLIKDHIDLIGQEEALIHNRSVIGPWFRRQRFEHSRQNAERKLMEKVDAYWGVGPWNRMNRRTDR